MPEVVGNDGVDVSQHQGVIGPDHVFRHSAVLELLDDEVKADATGADANGASFVHPELHRPQVCLLTLGKLVFKGVITEIDFSYSDIDANGDRHRVDVSLTMSNHLAAEEQLSHQQPE